MTRGEDGNLRDRLTAALRGHGADYAEIRVEESAATRLLYRGRELEDVGRSDSVGGCVRALVRGGWGFACFNNLEGLRRQVTAAVRQARLVGREESRLAPVAPVVEVVAPVVGKDPRAIPLAQKKELLDQYVQVIWSTPAIQSSNVRYFDGYRKVAFASSEGSYLEQSRIDVTLGLGAIARKGDDVQQMSISLGSYGDYAPVEGLHAQIGEAANGAVAMLEAPQVKGGEYTVVLDPILAGVFAHEAFGHLSESDFIYENERMQEIMVLGKTFGRPILNISDGAAIPGLRGSFKYDDEGAPASKTRLITNGVLTGRLHSRETAGKLGEAVTGNARAINYGFPPIVRMTNTIIEPGTTTLAEMLSDIKEGVYAKNWYGGMTSMEMYTFSAAEAFMIRNGQIAERLRPVQLSGNLFQTLPNIDAIGNDLDMNQGGGCGKGGQMPLPVSNGSPHIRIQKVLISGR